MTQVLDRPMAKRNDTSVKMDAPAVAKAKIAASIMGMSLAEFLTGATLEKAERVIAEFKSEPGSDPVPTPTPSKKKGGKA